MDTRNKCLQGFGPWLSPTWTTLSKRRDTPHMYNINKTMRTLKNVQKIRQLPNKPSYISNNPFTTNSPCKLSCGVVEAHYIHRFTLPSILNYECDVCCPLKLQDSWPQIGEGGNYKSYIGALRPQPRQHRRVKQQWCQMIYTKFDTYSPLQQRPNDKKFKHENWWV